MKPEDFENIEAQTVFLCEEVKEIHIHLESATNVAPPATPSNDNRSEGNQVSEEIEDHSGMTGRKAIEQLRELSLAFYQFDRENGGSWRPKEVADTLDEIWQYLEVRL